MRTNTDRYLSGHGTEPRGRGCWAFELTGTDGRGSYTTETVFCSLNTLSAARKYAVRKFKSECGAVKEVVECVVLP